MFREVLVEWSPQAGELTKLALLVLGMQDKTTSVHGPWYAGLCCVLLHDRAPS